MIKEKKSKKIISSKHIFYKTKNNIIALLIIVVCILFIINPSFYSKSCLNGITVWGFNVLPMLLPFFIFTRIIVELLPPKKNILDKPFKKFYNAPDGSFLVFFLSVVSGYPMGAKLISVLYDNKNIDNNDALTMLSYSSISGPMFMIGTVGVSIFLSYKAGLIIFISNILACLINGFIFKKKKSDYKKENKTIATPIKSKDISNIITDSVYDSLNSILIVGVYIVLSFLLIDLLKNIGLITNLSNAICCVFHIERYQNVVESILFGLIEITRGNIELASTNISLHAKTIISSGLIGFGGISVMFQSIAFIKKFNFSIKTIFLEKLSQGALSVFIAFLITLLAF